MEAILQASGEEAAHSARKLMVIPAQAFLRRLVGKGAGDMQKTHSHGGADQRALGRGHSTKPALGQLALCPSILNTSI